VDTFVQSAKNNELWRLALDADIVDCLGEIKEVMVWYNHFQKAQHPEPGSH